MGVIKTSYAFRLDVQNIKSSHLNAYVLLSYKYDKLLEQYIESDCKDEEKVLGSKLEVIEYQMRLLLVRQDLPLEEILLMDFNESV